MSMQHRVDTSFSLEKSLKDALERAAKQAGLSQSEACRAAIEDWVAAQEGRDMAEDGEMLLTIFLKHQQEMPLAEINDKLERNGFWKNFPPDGVEVVSYYVMMGIGQVVTLRLPGHRLRDVNLAIERSAWGSFRTEFYATYDFMPVFRQNKARQS